MTFEIFLPLLAAFATISSLVTEAIKKLMNDKANLSYNIVVLVVSLIVGMGGTAIYYQFHAIDFSTNNVIYMMLMGFASGLVAMVSFDKVKQAIIQLTGKRID